MSQPSSTRMRKAFDCLHSESDLLLGRFLEEPGLTISSLVSRVYGTGVTALLEAEAAPYCLRGSVAYGLGTSRSDIDLVAFAPALAPLTKGLRLLGLEPKVSTPSPDLRLFGRHPFLKLHHGFAAGHEISLHVESIPLSAQCLVVHTLFLRRIFRADPRLFRTLFELKQRATLRQPGGYHKAHIIAFERQMLADLGFCPPRVERDPLGFVYPDWDGPVSPIDWVFLRETASLKTARASVQPLFDKRPDAS